MRFRLAAAFVVWTAAAQVVVSGVFVLAREVVVLQGIDGVLQTSAEQLLIELQKERAWPPALEPAVARMQSREVSQMLPLVLRARSRDNSTLSIWPSRDAALGMATEPPAARLMFITSRAPLQRYTGGPVEEIRFRTATVPVRDAGGASYFLDVGTSLELPDRVTNLVLRLLATGLAAGVLVAAFAGWIVAGRLTRRIDRVTTEVASVSPSRLQEPRRLETGDDEIGWMAEALNQMLQRLASAFRSQEVFISNVAHELKTPIATLLSQAQVFKSQKSDAESARRLALSVEEECRRLGSLVETFLSLARFGDGQAELNRTVVSLIDIATESVQQCTNTAEQHGVRLRLQLVDPSSEDSEPLTRGDGDLLRVAINNLLRNAVQVSSAGDAVDVHVDVDAQTVVIAVADRGPGVPRELVDRIFDRFFQVPNRTMGRRGTGLGLNIAKTIVDLHRGSIQVQDREQGGCVFSIRLPLARRAEGESEGSERSGAEALTRSKPPGMRGIDRSRTHG